jgi:hypothetical protein
MIRAVTEVVCIQSGSKPGMLSTWPFMYAGLEQLDRMFGTRYCKLGCVKNLRTVTLLCSPCRPQLPTASAPHLWMGHLT